MTIHVEAIYEDGVFRPTHAMPVQLADGTKVRMMVGTAPGNAPPTDLGLAAKVYGGLSKEDVDAIEQIAIGNP